MRSKRCARILETKEQQQMKISKCKDNNEMVYVEDDCDQGCVCHVIKDG